MVSKANSGAGPAASAAAACFCAGLDGGAVNGAADPESSKGSAARRALLALGHGEAGDPLERGDVVHVAVVDQLLREVADLGRVADFGAHGEALLEVDQAGVEAEADKPEYVGIHAGAAGVRRRANDGRRRGTVQLKTLRTTPEFTAFGRKPPGPARVHGRMHSTQKHLSLPRVAALSALLLAGSALTLTSGCIVAAAGAGAGAVAYVRGDLNATLDASLDRCVHAADRAVEQLQFAKVSESKDALQGVIVARNAADKKIKIEFEHASDTQTKISIRVGVFGDETISMAILDKMKAAL